MIIRILFIISGLIFFAKVCGQQIVVISSSDRAPIEHVAVFNSTKESAALTDSMGVIDLSIFDEKDSIIFQHPSYLTKKIIKTEISGQSQVSMDRNWSFLRE